MHDHEKFLDIPPDAASLWLHAGSWSAGHRTDGFIPASLIRRWRGCTKRSAAELVRRGLWDDEGEGWRFHDWPDWQPTKGEYETPTDQVRWKRRKALQRDRLLCERICQRDRNQCRYCGVRVNWKARTGATSGTYDHVDPDGTNDISNVVVACRKCNGVKKDRTPEEAGMKLLAVPDPRPESGQAEAGPTPGNGQAALALARETGRGQDGPETGSGQGQDVAVLNGAGPVQNGSRNGGQ